MPRSDPGPTGNLPSMRSMARDVAPPRASSTGDVCRFDRADMRREIERRVGRHDDVDLVVIGGGITGCGVALDAASRGMSVALFERGDLASGTSSMSSKMVHGGLRYLQNGEVRLVYEALRERGRLMRNAPNLVEVLPFLIPIMTRDGVVKKKIARALGSAMWMYDVTGGWRIGRLHRRASAEEAAAHFPTAHLDRLSAGYVYYDAGADDARLTLTVARTAAAHGAVVLNHAPVTGFVRRDDGLVAGVTVDVDGDSIDVGARAVVNATGVWSDRVAGLDGRRDTRIRPAKGVHIAVPWDLVRNDVAVIVPSAHDRRSVFLVPWGPRSDGTFRSTYVGTTDTDYDGSLDRPGCDGDDIDYLLDAVNRAITTPVGRDDVTGVWAGLRPLVATADGPGDATADLSRRHVVERGDDGIVSVNGGKLTTYRAMAEETVDAVVALRADAPRSWRRHPTRRLRLDGATSDDAPAGSPEHHLLSRFGRHAGVIDEMVRADRSLGARLVEGLPYLRAEAVYAVRDEMALHLDDVLLRRTRAHLFDRDATMGAAPAIADLLAAEAGWSVARRDEELDRYEQICRREMEAARHHADVADSTH